MDRCLHGRTVGWTKGQSWVDGRADGGTKGLTIGWMDVLTVGQTNGQLDGQTDVCI